MKHPIQLHRKLYKLLNDSGSFSDRHEIVLEYTGGRTENSSEMTTEEVLALIRDLEKFQKDRGAPLNDFQKGDAMRKRVLSLFHQYGFTIYSREKRKMIVDFERLDNWMVKYSYLHKKLNKYKYSELPKLVSQVEQFVIKYIKAV
jgi:hypothetical protein